MLCMQNPVRDRHEASGMLRWQTLTAQPRDYCSNALYLPTVATMIIGLDVLLQRHYGSAVKERKLFSTSCYLAFISKVPSG